MPERSWLGRRDDRARLLSLLLLALCVASLQGLASAGAGVALGGLLCVGTRLGLRVLARRLLPLLALLVPVWLLTPLWAPPGSTPLFPAWAWGPTDAGLAETALVSSRVLAVALVVIAFLEAAPFDRTIQALQRLT
jgi:energy-coupling factor transporter transmembrane protein EcfT